MQASVLFSIISSDSNVNVNVNVNVNDKLFWIDVVFNFELIGHYATNLSTIFHNKINAHI